MLSLFDTTGFMPHGFCLLWQPWLIALHAGSDALIAASYFVIPIAIVRVVRARRDPALNGVASLFAAFILLCGATHLTGLVTLWSPIYELEGLLKAATAGVSMATAIVAFPLAPKLAALPSPATLEAANERLRSEIRRHESTMDALRAARDDLEAAVAERTAELRDANARLEVISREAQHRAKNTLAVVQAIARQSAAGAEDKDELSATLAARIGAMAQALDAAADENGEGAMLREVVERQLAPYGTRGRAEVEVDGPPVHLGPEAAQMIALMSHELATNAAKHGGLRANGGRVRVRWRIDDAAPAPEVVLNWEETLPPGAPPPSPSTRRGFGSRLLDYAAPAQLDGTSERVFVSDGMRYTVRLPLAALARDGEVQAATPEVERAPVPRLGKGV